MKDVQNHTFLAPSKGQIDMAKQIQAQRSLSAYLQRSQWDEAMQRRRQNWLYARKHKKSTQ